MYFPDKSQSDTQFVLNPVMDYEWFESVFGEKYSDLFDGDVIYDY